MTYEYYINKSARVTLAVMIRRITINQLGENFS